VIKMAETTGAPLLQTPLHAAHQTLGARMVPFAGYDMPVQYPFGVMGEHNWTREHAGLFDVSHMGQCFVTGPDWETTARALETLVPADILNLRPGQQRYSQLLNADGGILDDLMIARSSAPGHEGRAFLVVNAGCKEQDYAHLAAHLPAGVRLERLDDHALLALQGPEAAAVLSSLVPGIETLPFMQFRAVSVKGAAWHITRAGYTGEDGFEISVKDQHARALWDQLLDDQRVKPVGLGARDSLRLEAGLCLYGHDIDTSTSPVEAALVWSLQKRRREEGGFPGSARVQRELASGPARLRVGIRPDGRQPAREGTEIMIAGQRIGHVTSGGFGPTLGAPLAMGYVEAAYGKAGQRVSLLVRGRELPAGIVPMPFVPQRYFRTA
jgi:aminomethyltransferase